jgi:endoglucanase
MYFGAVLSRRLAALAALFLLAAACAVGAAQADPPGSARAAGSGDCSFPRRAVKGDKQARSPSAPNPLRGEKWYVDPTEPAYAGDGPGRPGYLQYAGSNPKAAALMAKIAFTPRFKWFGRFTPAPRRICSFIEDAEASGAVPLVATLRGQSKECNSRYQGGGVAEDRATKQWFDDFARGIGTSRVIIAFEPDSIGTISCLAKGRRKARMSVLRHGVDVLSKLPHATVYIEGTASDWKPASYTASRLRSLGVSKVRGFMLNVTHYDWTASNIRYGLRVSKKLGGKHFIISTAQNGRGPVHYQRGKRRINVFCHPLYRGAGPYPTTHTANSKVDAYMWVNRPGYSGGRCNGGPTPAGTWWPKRALMLARYQSNQIRPPRHNNYGFSGRHLTIRQVAGDQYHR